MEQPCARAVDAVALLAAHADADAVAQYLLRADGERTDVEHQHRAGLAERISDAAAIHPRGAIDEGEATRQAVDHAQRTPTTDGVVIVG